MSEELHCDIDPELIGDDYEDAKKFVMEYGRKLRLITDNQSRENGISTLAVFYDTDYAEKHEDENTTVFMGGVIASHCGTDGQVLEMLFQLARVIYLRQVEETNQEFTDMLFDAMIEKIKAGQDYFKLSKTETMLRMMMKRLKKAAEEDEE